MVDVRMLFSALVDADYLDTAAHFAGTVSGPTPVLPTRRGLRAREALDLLTEHVGRLPAGSGASETVNDLRADLWNACLAADSADQQLWTLTAPTGAGKTLAMLGFALQQAVRRELDGIIVVIPYLQHHRANRQDLPGYLRACVW